MINNFAEAHAAAVRFSGRSEEDFETVGIEGLDAWLVAPADHVPEGSPCFMVFRDGRILKKNYGNRLEVDQFINSPLTQEVSL